MVIKYTIFLLLLFFNWFLAPYAQASTEKEIFVALKIDDQWSEIPTALINELKTVNEHEWNQKSLEILNKSSDLQKFYDISLYQHNTKTTVFYVIEAKTLLYVSQIKITGLQRKEEEELSSIFKLKAEKIFHPQLFKSDIRKIKEKFDSRGYLNAQIENTVQLNQNKKIFVGYEVYKNNPCLIAEVILEPKTKVIDFITNPIETGTLCDLTLINEAAEKEQNRLRNEGYLEADVHIKSIDYTNDFYRAIVKLHLFKGSRTKVEIINSDASVQEKIFRFKEALSQQELANLSEEELRNEVANDFIKRGYHKVKVLGPETLVDDNNNKIIRFNVQPGPQLFIGEIKIEGELPDSKEEILKKFDLSTNIFKKSIPFIEEKINQLSEKIEDYSIKLGYLDAKVTAPIVTISKNENFADIFIRIDLGKIYKIKNIQISGLRPDTPIDFKKLNAIIKNDDTLNADKLQEYTDEFKLQMLSLGYTYGHLQITQKNIDTLTTNERYVNILVAVHEGNEVRIGKIITEGDLFDKSNRILDESGLKEGSIYNPNDLDKARQRLLKHGLFSNVEIKILDRNAFQKKSDTLDIVIKPIRSPSYQLGFGPGWGSLKGYRFNIDFTKSNVTHHGLRFFSSASISQEKEQNTFGGYKQLLGRQYSLGVAEPLFSVLGWTSPIDLSFSFGGGAIVQPIYNRFYTVVQTEGIWRPLWLEHSWDISGKFIAENSQLLGNQLPVLDAIEKGDTLHIREIISSVALDTRNSREWPTSGGRYEVNLGSARFSLLSELQYNRINFSTDSYTSFFDRFSAGLSLGALRIFDVENKSSETATVPGSRRATMTGASLIRGFPESGLGLGPLIWLKRSGNSSCTNILKPTGATNLIYIKQETRYRSPLFTNSLGFAVFVDTGLSFFLKQEAEGIRQALKGRTIQGSEENGCTLDNAGLIDNLDLTINNAFKPQNYKKYAYASAGVGIRYIVPNFAAISFDWGIPFSEPGQNTPNCLSESAALASTTEPTCVLRKQQRSIMGTTIPGAFHFNLGASF